MKLLLIEDADRLRESLTIGLSRSGFAVDSVASAEAASAFLRSYDYKIVVLDLMLPGESGLSWLKRLRQSASPLAVLVLSARDQLGDRIEALNAGADDYLVKPFAFDELLARLGALVRRTFTQRSPIISLPGFDLDTAKKCVVIGAKNLELASREFMLLELLARERGKLHSRRQIFDALSNGDRDCSDRVIEGVVSGLRKKLETLGVVSPIKNQRGLGYVIE
jgi:two-component system, OmpR family, response regulator QseB